MPRIPRHLFNIRTQLFGPSTSPDREKALKVVERININPDIEALLKKPTWSVASLLPPSLRQHSSKTEDTTMATSQDASTEDEITVQKLHHLLRLSALPPPKSEVEERDMLRTLRQQVHFVKEIQKVDTRGVEPLVAIRDETREARREKTITRESLSGFIALEEKKGRNGTIRRIKDTYQVTSRTPEDEWNHVPAGGMIEEPWEMGDGGEGRKMGRFFYVKKGKKDAAIGSSAETETETETETENKVEAETGADAKVEVKAKRGNKSQHVKLGEWMEVGFRKVPFPKPRR